MIRFFAIALLAFLTLATALAQAGADKDKMFNVKGKLSADDPKDAQRGGPMKSHTVAMKAGAVYTIDMQSSDFDSYLRLLDPKGNQLEEDDDSGGNLNAKIIFNCTKDGDYKIIATTFGAKAAGSYTLQVKNAGTSQKAATGHAQLIGKPAPNFNSEFALNGKSVKLGDLKGSVAVLYFWEVRSSAAAALMPTLNNWHKMYQKEGVAIVGATFYTHEIGQRLAWDKENGKLISTEAADRKSDQALLKAYAEHHKIEHLWLALPKQDALAAFDAYVVNAVPQVVLIDRKGTVRLIDIGGEKGAANVEMELKKLLAEK